MELLKIRVVLFLDIGGYLFPDHPTLDTPPHTEIISMTRKHCRLWGSHNCFIAANVSERYDIGDENHLHKDIQLLEKFDVHKRAGLIKDDLYFYKCYGPAWKGRELKRRAEVIERTGYRVLQVICDNSITVAKSASPEAHCIVYNAKGLEDPANSDWMKLPHSRLYLVNSAYQIASLTARIHLGFIKEAAAQSAPWVNDQPGLKTQMDAMYKDELNRTLSILRISNKRVPPELFQL